MILVADPRYEREIYHDHGNRPIGQDQTDVLIFCEPLHSLPDHITVKLVINYGSAWKVAMIKENGASPGQGEQEGRAARDTVWPILRTPADRPGRGSRGAPGPARISDTAGTVPEPAH
jgi:hypothetical protein